MANDNQAAQAPQPPQQEQPPVDAVTMSDDGKEVKAPAPSDQTAPQQQEAPPVAAANNDNGGVNNSNSNNNNNNNEAEAAPSAPHQPQEEEQAPSSSSSPSSPPPDPEGKRSSSLVGGGGASPQTSEKTHGGWGSVRSHVKVLKNMSQAVGKVKLENKIGRSASDLDDNDPLKAISLATQRAIKSFGASNNNSNNNNNNNNGSSSSSSLTTLSETRRAVKFSAAEVISGDDSSRRSNDNTNNNDHNHNKTTADEEQHQKSFTATSTPATPSFDVRQPAFQCIEHFHDIFQDIRASFGITERQFYAVLALQDKAKLSSFSVIGSGDTSGKSPSFFFLSPDQRFILKSCTKQDVKTLSKILPRYRDHVKTTCHCGGNNNNNNNNGGSAGCSSGNTNSSLLPRYIGLYTFQFLNNDDDDKGGDGTRKHTKNDTTTTTTTLPLPPDCTLVVMTNFFAGTHQIHKKYDLKGSTYHREASEKERAKKSPVFKDLDWVNDGRRLTFCTKADVASITQRLEKDTSFLCQENLIDYSLLIGVHSMHDNEKDGNKSKSDLHHHTDEVMDVIFARSDTEVQYFGLVDILTTYGLKKKCETIFTGTLLCRPNISCQPPPKYQKRFMNFVADEILACRENKK